MSITRMRPFTPSQLIPIGDLTLQDRHDLRESVDNMLAQAFIGLAIKNNLADVVVRDTLPNVDLNLTARGSSDSWQITGAGVQGTELQYLLPTNGVANNLCIAFWGLETPMAVPNISWVRFALGSSSTTTKAKFQLEQMYARLESAAYFGTPVVYLRGDALRVTVMPRLAFAANSEDLIMLARTAEPLGVQISAPIV